MQMDELFQLMVDRGASDLHIKPARPPMIRLNGKMVTLEADPLPPDVVREMMLSLLDPRQTETLEANRYIDLAHSVPGLSRFRASIYHQRGSLSGVFRRVPVNFPTLDEWDLPEVLKDFTRLPQGLVLVTGPTGSGKSSTLAAMVREALDTRPVHVVTIEDPIEFLIRDGMGVVSQREIGTDTRSFSDALRNTVRQDPDVIMVGEMRDVETMETVLNAAETGHLVFSTLHTNSAAQTIERIVSAFPESNHRHIHQQLSQVLAAVVSLKLVERCDGSGMVAAVEIMTGSPRVQKLILEGGLQELQEEIERSVGFERMQSLNQSLAALVINGIITRGQAIKQSTRPADLDLLLRKTFALGEDPDGAGEDEMGASKADFSHILRLQEVQKSYEELEERYQRDMGARDEQIRKLVGELQARTKAVKDVQGTVQGLTADKEKLERQVAFQRQEYETKLEKLQNRVRELSASSTETSRSGIFRR